jgi:sugar phosphate isomerase/epimerase
VLTSTAELLQAYAACGVNRIELFPGHYDPAAHTPAEDRLFLQQVASAGMKLSTFGVVGLYQEAPARRIFEFACEAGFDVINADLEPQHFAMVERLCEEYQRKVMVHNHGRKHRWGHIRALETLFAQTSPKVGLCLDTALMLDAGDDPLQAARRFQDRLYGLHLKDYLFDRAGHGVDVIIGTGNLDLQGMIDFLKGIDFDGVLTLEYEGDHLNPIPATKECADIVRSACRP